MSIFYKFLCFIFLFSSIISDEYNDSLNELSLLEDYTIQYINIVQNSRSLNSYLFSYIRSAKYNSTEWEIICGSTPTDLIDYINQIDIKYNTTINNLRKYGEIKLPNGNKMDFIHMFAVMDGIDNNSKDFKCSGAQLVGWGGDLAQLFQDIHTQTGSLDELIAYARSILGISGQFGEGDLIADLDAVNLLALRYDNPNIKISDLYDNYISNEGYKKRISTFINKSFDLNESSSQEEFRNTIYNEYTKNLYIQIWECKNNLRNGILKCLLPSDVKPEYAVHQKAACYAFADYLYENRNN